MKAITHPSAAHDLLNTLAFVVARPILSGHFHDRCCVAATRAAIDVCAAWGLRAKAQLVEFDAVSPTWSVGVTHEPIPGDTGIPGHLVCLVQVGKSGYILDLAAYQADRPEHGLSVPTGLFLPVRANRLKGDRLITGAKNGETVVRYIEHRRPETPWAYAPDWRLPTAAHAATHRRVVSELRDGVRYVMSARQRSA